MSEENPGRCPASLSPITIKTSAPGLKNKKNTSKLGYSNFYGIKSYA
jgi:hypothetical protein